MKILHALHYTDNMMPDVCWKTVPHGEVCGAQLKSQAQITLCWHASSHLEFCVGLGFQLHYDESIWYKTLFKQF